MTNDPYAQRAALKRAADNVFRIVEPDSLAIVRQALLAARDRIGNPSVFEWRTPALMLVDEASPERVNCAKLQPKCEPWSLQLTTLLGQPAAVLLAVVKVGNCLQLRHAAAPKQAWSETMNTNSFRSS